MIRIQLPDGSVREVSRGTTAYDVATSISPRLAAAVVVAGRSGIFKEKSIVATEASTTLSPLEFQIKADKNLPAETHENPY